MTSGRVPLLVGIALGGFSVAVPAAADPARTTVHVNSPEQVRVEVQTDEGWKPLCDSPCDRAVPAQVTVRVAGDGVRASRSIDLMSVAPSGGAVSLDVEPRSSSGAAVGTALLIIGGMAIVGGVVVELAGGAGCFGGCTNGDSNIDSFVAGIGVASLGGVLGLTGAILLLPRTHVSAVPASAPSPPEPQPAAAKPAWHSPEVALPRAAEVPLFSVRF